MIGVGVTVGVGVGEGVAGRGVAVGRAVTVGIGVERGCDVGVSLRASTATGWGVINCPQADKQAIAVIKSIICFIAGHYTTGGEKL